MTPRDGFPRLLARSVRRRDAQHRKACATQSYPLAKSRGRPPYRSPPQTPRNPGGGRRKVLPMIAIACGFSPTRRTAETISRGHYLRSSVLGPVDNHRNAMIVATRLRFAP